LFLRLAVDGVDVGGWVVVYIVGALFFVLNEVSGVEDLCEMQEWSFPFGGLVEVFLFCMFYNGGLCWVWVGRWVSRLG
jgi:hypothetical protein